MRITDHENRSTESAPLKRSKDHEREVCQNHPPDCRDPHDGGPGAGGLRRPGGAAGSPSASGTARPRRQQQSASCRPMPPRWTSRSYAIQTGKGPGLPGTPLPTTKWMATTSPGNCASAPTRTTSRILTCCTEWSVSEDNLTWTFKMHGFPPWSSATVNPSPPTTWSSPSSASPVPTTTSSGFTAWGTPRTGPRSQTAKLRRKNWV